MATSSTPLVVHDHPTRPTPLPAGLVGGLGGLVFVAAVLAQNALRAGFPPNDASAPRIIGYYLTHGGATWAFAVLYPVGACGLVAFLGSMLARVTGREQRPAAIVGAIGATGVVATYTMLVATDLGLAAYVRRPEPTASVVDGLWTLHLAVFGTLLTCIGLALAGLTAASAGAGHLPTWWKGLGLAGAVLLLTASMTTPAMIDSSPTLFVGLAGFLVWVAFVTTNSIVLLRNPRP